MTPTRNSHWLCSPGEYRQLIEDLHASDPRLKNRDPKNVTQAIPWPPQTPRCALLEISSHGNTVSHAEHDPTTLEGILARGQRKHPSDDRSRVYIVEGVHPDFVAVLGAQFNMHPSFWVEHERTDVMEENVELVPPSTTNPREFYVMQYVEPLYLPESIVKNRFTMCCAVTGRHISVTRKRGQFLEVCMLRRKCSIWRRARGSGPGWDCVVLTDPPLQKVSVHRKDSDGNSMGRETIVVTPHLFRGGYTDFLPHSSQIKMRRGPPRHCMLKDLCFYLEHHSKILYTNHVDAVSLFSKKIVASQYLLQCQFLRWIVGSNHYVMSRQRSIDLHHFSLEFVEAQWSDSQSLERRLCEYCENIEAIMQQLHIPVASPDPAKVHDWTDTASDFQYIYMRFQDLRRRAEMLNASNTALASMSGNRQASEEQDRSLREARSTKALILLGVFFIPLAYVSSLLSMTEPFGPGRPLVWIYFAISFPLVIVVVGAYHALGAAYDARTHGVFSFRFRT